jgi:AraC-like DNA-binding protein
MFELANKLIDNPYLGAMRLIFTESLVMQLAVLAVGGIGALSGAPNEEYSPREVRCMHAARRMLMDQLSQPPTIRQLARAAGINETTLKRGFKSLFGETIFDFSVRCRMQHALSLLREQRVPVAEVGEAVGYRHQTSFATAFRRHFGMRPKDVRRSRPA